MPRFTESKSGSRMATAHIKVHVPEEMVQWVAAHSDMEEHAAYTQCVRFAMTLEFDAEKCSAKLVASLAGMPGQAMSYTVYLVNVAETYIDEDTGVIYDGLMPIVRTPRGVQW